MKSIPLKLNLDSDEVIYVEVEETDNAVPHAYSFDEALDTIRMVSGAIVSKVQETEQIPDQVNVELGLKFDSEVGAVISKHSALANLRINLTWKRKEGSREEENKRYYKEKLKSRNLNV